MGDKKFLLILCAVYCCYDVFELPTSLADATLSTNNTNTSIPYSNCSSPCQSSRSKDQWLGKTDPSSFSNSEDFQTKSISLQWNVDFGDGIIFGSVTYDFVVHNRNASMLILDTQDISVNKIISSATGEELAWNIGQTVASFGEPLTIVIGDLVKAKANDSDENVMLKIRILYTTSPNSTALQWLEPLQTAGKMFPYVFSQCWAIHARSLLPCQDTPSVKFTYTAQVSVPKDLQALMSAVQVGEPRPDEKNDNNMIYKFEQNIPIPSYLIAIAVGDMVSRVIGPRSRVWSERILIDAAVAEFGNTEAMLVAAENLFGKYVWGTYDILVMPPSFPYGGTENPCLTFVTPTLLVGDKSAVNVVAHEIAHSWTGNMVTNKNWENFWLNEGFTQFAERKVLGALHGEKFRQFESIGGWKELSTYIKGREAEAADDDPRTQLVVDLNGVDPDDAFSIVPYEKGYAFLYYLEQRVGGPGVFEPFLRHYIQNNSYKSVDTDDFKSGFINYFNCVGLTDKISDIDWNTWFYSPGMPPFKNEYDTTLSRECTDLTNRWVEWHPSSSSSSSIPFNKSDIESLLPVQIQLFLQELLERDEEVMPFAKIEAMEKAYAMSNRKNPEIRFRWIRLAVRAKWPNILASAFDFVNSQGRLKYLRPIYKELYKWEEVRAQVIDNYKSSSRYMMAVVRKALQRELKV